MDNIQLTATSIKDISTAQLSALRIAHEHNLELIEKELRSRKLEEEDSETTKTVVVRLGSSKVKDKSPTRITIKKNAVKKNAVKKSTSVKKVKPTIKDMQNILSSHDISFAKSWSRDRYWSLIKKHNLIRETKKFTEVRLGLLDKS